MYGKSIGHESVRVETGFLLSLYRINTSEKHALLLLNYLLSQCIQ